MSSLRSLLEIQMNFTSNDEDKKQNAFYAIDNIIDFLFDQYFRTNKSSKTENFTFNR